MRANKGEAFQLEATAEGATMEIVSVGRGPIRGYRNRLIPSRLMRCRKCGATHTAYAPYSYTSWFCMNLECEACDPYARELAAEWKAALEEEAHRVTHPL
jgi:hypothetical protein